MNFIKHYRITLTSFHFCRISMHSYFTRLLNHPLWWHGLRWLALSHQEWPNTPPLVLGIIPELSSKPLHIEISFTTKEWDLLTKYSNWTSSIQILVYVLKFIKSYRTKIGTSHKLSPQELEISEQIIIKLVQQHHFPEELQLLRNAKFLHHETSTVVSLLGWQWTD